MVLVLVAAYVVWFIHLNFLLYYSYGEPPFDLSVFDQGMWLISHFRDPFVTIMGRNLVGDHTSFVLYLFAPLYRLFSRAAGPAGLANPVVGESGRTDLRAGSQVRP